LYAQLWGECSDESKLKKKHRQGRVKKKKAEAKKAFTAKIYNWRVKKRNQFQD